MENWKVDVTGEYADGTLTLRDGEGGEETIEIGTNPKVKTRTTTSPQGTLTHYSFEDVNVLLFQNRRDNIATIRIAENKVDPDVLYNGSLADTTGNAMKTELDKSISSGDPQPHPTTDPTPLEGGKKKRRKNKKKTVRRLKKKRTTRKKF